MVMPLPQEREYTIEDIFNLPDGTRGELIDGQIYYMATPGTSHQRISGHLYNSIYNYIKTSKGNCEAFTAPFAVYLNKDESEYYEPDISVICDPGKLDDKGCKGAPDWIIEIVSPSNPGHDYVLKLNKYMCAGVREYWIVDPHNQSVAIYYFESEKFILNYTFQDKIKVNIYDDLIIDFNQLDI